MITLFSSLILSLVVALVSASIPWTTTWISRWWLAAAFGVGVVLSVLIAGLSLQLYPFTDLVVLLVGLSAGVLLGRSLPARTWPLLILLLALSALDITQSVLSSHAAGVSYAVHTAAIIPPPGQLVGNFFLVLPWGHFNIGIFDIFVLATMAEHCRRHGASWALAQSAGIIGIVLAFAFLKFVYSGALPLIPFLTVGWLCTLALARSMSRQRKAVPPAK
ncbi:MAG: hypothetical protein ABI068_15155 [Ktedonobacterales bacterium]